MKNDNLPKSSMRKTITCGLVPAWVCLLASFLDCLFLVCAINLLSAALSAATAAGCSVIKVLPYYK